MSNMPLQSADFYITANGLSFGFGMLFGQIEQFEKVILDS